MYHLIYNIIILLLILLIMYLINRIITSLINLEIKISKLQIEISKFKIENIKDDKYLIDKFIAFESHITNEIEELQESLKFNTIEIFKLLKKVTN